MKKLSGFVVRIALAVPMAYETYRIGEGQWHALHEGVPPFQVVVSALPALGVPLGCVLLIALPHARWAWLAVAASGLLLLSGSYVTAHIANIAVQEEKLTLATSAAIGAYAVVLASACMLTRPKILIDVTGIGREASRPSRL